MSLRAFRAANHEATKEHRAHGFGLAAHHSFSSHAETHGAAAHAPSHDAAAHDRENYRSIGHFIDHLRETELYERAMIKVEDLMRRGKLKAQSYLDLGIEALATVPFIGRRRSKEISLDCD